MVDDGNEYESLLSNKYQEKYQNFIDYVLQYELVNRHVRVWHYTKLTDEEVSIFEKQLIPASENHLCNRLNRLVEIGKITENDKNHILDNSRYYTEPNERLDLLWTTLIPCSANNSRVELLLGYWGGEGAYFGLSNSDPVRSKLKEIGRSRICEISVPLTEFSNALSAAITVAKAWARKFGIGVSFEGSDPRLGESLVNAKVLKIHTEGIGRFQDIGLSYPERVEEIPNSHFQ
ncbi:hypothetical protein [Kiloniella litopenaei]|uniref:hypothetical protein n=1 Tax=Kiloniella litopenaei TaxID=1549748 RepID=UPI0012FEDB9B|nr:hypothetical protein [Kiloniella litopenaei]